MNDLIKPWALMSPTSIAESFGDTLEYLQEKVFTDKGGQTLTARTAANVAHYLHDPHPSIAAEVREDLADLHNSLMQSNSNRLKTQSLIDGFAALTEKLPPKEPNHDRS